jgi:integrase
MATWTTGENWRDGVLYVRQGKVEGHGTGLLKITPGGNLLAAIIACLNAPERDDCPYLVHAVPRKAGRKAKWRTHPLQLAPDTLTREFKRIGDAQKVFEGMTEEQKPTWHEIRALGGDVYRTELGWSDERVQALMGHTTAKMTRNYLDGHGERWADVTAG